MSIWNKIKGRGFRGTMIAVADKIISAINKGIYLMLRFFLPLDNSLIVMESEGDCSDNAYAFFRYLKKEGLIGTYKIVWLVSHVEKFSHEPNIRYYYKCWGGKVNFKRARALATCKYYIYDHCNMLEFKKSRKGQKYVFLMHGCGFKSTSNPDLSFKSTADEGYDIGEFYHEVMATHMHCRLERMLGLGYPRTDYFFEEICEEQKNFMLKYSFQSYKKVILWMPTFRRSANIELDESYFDNITGLPILESEEQLKKFDCFLQEKNILCIFKIHHLQAKLNTFSRRYSNIVVLSDEEIIANNLQLYQVIMLTDCLISDYSSISNDYLLLNKPIIYTLDDYEQYKKSRGFVFENPKDYMPGYHIVNQHELESAICEIVDDNLDKYESKRKEIISLMYDYTDGNSSKRIANHLGITNNV